MTEEFVHDLFKWDILFRMEEENGNILRKSSKVSKEERENGNQLYAKKNHDKNIHKDIFLQYTKSIAFAPKDSEELALGYSNRSVLLMHLHFYEKCLIDICRALGITKSDQLKTKLESRKEKCMLLMKKSLEKDTNNLNLDEDELNISVPSNKLQCAAESVTLKCNETYGRYLSANRNIKPGEIIIAEKGYACYPQYHQIYVVCSHCLSFAWNGIPCDFCVFAIYCNENCKNEAWQEYHSIECSLLKFLYFNKNIYPIDAFFVTRIFIKAVKTEGFDNVMNETQFVHHVDDISRLLSNGVIDSNKFRSCYNLHCHVPDDDDIYEKMIIFLLIKYTDIIDTEIEAYNTNNEKLLIKLRNILMKLRGILKVNGFYYQWSKCTCSNMTECTENKCETIRGLFIANCSSFINHSCMPNVSKVFIQPRKIVFYASRPIKKGEPLCCSYGPTVTMDQISRQQYILDNHYFKCACTACKRNITITNDFSKYTDQQAILNIFLEFCRMYKDGATSPFFKALPNEWTVFNKELLEQALKIIELTNSHFKNDTAFANSIPYMNYVRYSFNNLYGEKYVMPDDC